MACRPTAAPDVAHDRRAPEQPGAKLLLAPSRRHQTLWVAPVQSNATSHHRVTSDGIDGRLALTNEELRSKNMTAKQWAARAVVAATMAAGLSACGGGGDSAAPATTPTPEMLTVGLTLKNSTGDAPASGSYTVTVTASEPDKILTPRVGGAATQVGGGATQVGVTSVLFSDAEVNPKFQGTVTYTADGVVTRAVLFGEFAQDKPVACGIDGISNPCIGFKVDFSGKTFSATSVVMKSINSSWTGLNTVNPGQVTVSGIVKF
jgi:hypothetical protein